jgi:hypothetical protein
MANVLKGKKAPRGKQITAAQFKQLWMNPDLRAKDIAVELGISTSAVISRARTRGLPDRKQLGIVFRDRKIDDPEFADMYLSGVSLKDLYELYDCAHSVIARTAAKMMLPKQQRQSRSKISLDDYRALKLRSRMAAQAKIEAGHWRNAEMVDGSRSDRMVA